uniref:COP9 signalosome complex subunit 8 n=1 Tax=Ciona savignyi TaxID=51511 RepID=H2YNC3_CIOSA
MESNFDSQSQLLEERVSRLEESELESSQGKLSLEQYSELLSLYICSHDLLNARLLWKRIPDNIKVSSELKAIWEVGKAAWLSDYQAMHVAVQSFEWSTTIKSIMEAFTMDIKERYLKLVSDGYTSARISFLAELLGASESDVRAIVTSRGWTIHGDFVHPAKNKPDSNGVLNNEEHLEKLTQYILFLES